MFDCIISGAGPVGLYTAGLLEKNHSVLVLEEHGRIGRPNHCSGLISRNLEGLVKIRKEWVENRVKGAILHSPSGLEIRLEKPGTAAFVINREAFDRGLAGGLESGVRLNTRVLGFSVEKDRVRVKTSKGILESRVLVGCDGVGSLVAEGIKSRPREILNGLIAVVKEEDQGDFVELWFDKKATDGFLWRIPRGGSVEYGGIGAGLKFSLLEKFFGIRDYEKRGGRIPIGAGRSYAERVLLVGDAAGQVKPWSGGGIVYGLTCSRIAAGVLDRAFEKGDFSRGVLGKYERAWRAGIGGGIRAGMVFRRVYKGMGNRGIDAIFRAGKPMEFLMNKLDMDFLKKRG